MCLFHRAILGAPPAHPLALSLALLVLLLLVPARLCAQSGEVALPDGAIAGVEHVLVIGVDGMSPDGIRQAATPHLDALIERGAATMHARAVLPTSSSPNWASMLMGAGPEQHGITSNAWTLAAHTLAPTTTVGDGRFPTIFHLLREQRPDAYSAAVYDWGGFGRLFDHSDVDVASDADGPVATTEAAAEQLRRYRPALTFVHLDHVDHAGHAHGHGTAAYYAAVEAADAYIGQMLAALDDAGMAAATLVIVTSDHGGRGYGHGGDSLEEIEIPWIAAGPGVMPQTLTVPIDTYDTAATVAYALGLTPPVVWIARPVTEAFRPPTGAPSPYVAAPQVRPPGGLFVGETPTATLESDAPEVVIRYTLDGSLPGPDAPRYTEPLPITTTTVLRARAFAPAGASDFAAAFFRVVPEAMPEGVRYEYVEAPEGRRWEWLPDFDQLEATRTGRAHEFALDAVAPRDDDYAVRFVSTLEVTQAGRYRFATVSDDGSKLYVGGAEVVDNDGSHGARIEDGSIDLSPGRHLLEVHYFQGGGGHELQVWYAGPGVPFQPVPATRLLPPDAAAGTAAGR